MRIAASRLIPYRLPLRHPWRSAHGVVTHRAGWLVRLETDVGLVGFGDCAPLPDAGTETPESAREALQAYLSALQYCDPQSVLDEMVGVGFQTPAARCALEIALLDLVAQQAGVALAHGLNANAPLRFRANAAMGMLDDGVAGRAREALGAGFEVLKLKVGLFAPDSELAALRCLAAGLPQGAVLRLDANGAWDPEQARRFIEGLATLPVESLEEPLRNPDVAGLASLQALAPFPLALDESLGRLRQDALLGSLAVRRLVLKPMALGGVRPAYALALRAMAVGMECVVTSTVDSAVGVAAACHLAAALDNGLAHGVATSSWLGRDVGKPPRLENGWVWLDNAMSGLGFRPAKSGVMQGGR